MATDQGAGSAATLTAAQRNALYVVHEAGRDGCYPTSRASRGRGVNTRAADSLRRLGLVRFELCATGEKVTATAAGCAVLAEITGG